MEIIHLSHCELFLFIIDEDRTKVVGLEAGEMLLHGFAETFPRIFASNSKDNVFYFRAKQERKDAFSVK